MAWEAKTFTLIPKKSPSIKSSPSKQYFTIPISKLKLTEINWPNIVNKNI